MNITIITPVFPYPYQGILPGVESYVKSLALPLKKLGHNIKIVTTFWNGNKKYDKYKGIPILRIKDTKALFGKIGSIFHFNYITFGLNAFRKKNFEFYKDSDIIFMPLTVGIPYISKRKKIPIITAFLHYEDKNKWIDYLTLSFYHLLERIQFKNFREILTISHFSKNELVNKYGIKDKIIEVIPVGVDTKKFNPSNKSNELKHKYPGKILLCVGPFLKRKRISLLIKAMSKVLKKFPEVHLILIGKGITWEYCKRLSKIFKIQNHTSFLGFIPQEDLLKFYASSDIFVFPSELEGFGQVLLESMASGTPVICANKPPMSEIIGNAGITFEINNVEDLSEKILKLLNNKDELKTLGEKSIDEVEKYDLLKIAKKFSDYAKKILNLYKLNRLI
ncbi:MAG: glycosyltransferase family 4 protein [Candidatus Lokiarchaeia archaeon]